MVRVRIRQTRSGIGRLNSHKRVLRALGLRHPGSVVEHDDTATIRGMLDKVRHLVSIEIIQEDEATSEGE